MSAKTLYIENNPGEAKLADPCYDELSKWGRFKIVSDPKQADVIFQIGNYRDCREAGPVRGKRCIAIPVGVCRGMSAVAVCPSVSDATAKVLWSDTRRWVSLFTGFRSVTREVIKELKRRMEE